MMGSENLSREELIIKLAESEERFQQITEAISDIALPTNH